MLLVSVGGVCLVRVTLVVVGLILGRRRSRILRPIVYVHLIEKLAAAVLAVQEGPRGPLIVPPRCVAIEEFGGAVAFLAVGELGLALLAYRIEGCLLEGVGGSGGDVVAAVRMIGGVEELLVRVLGPVILAITLVVVLAVVAATLLEVLALVSPTVVGLLGDGRGVGLGFLRDGVAKGRVLGKGILVLPLVFVRPLQN